MGRTFGSLIKYGQVITYSISPFEQKAFAGVLKDGVPNVWRRFKESVLRVVPPLAISYGIYVWAKDLHAQSERKVPADFANDE